MMSMLIIIFIKRNTFKLKKYRIKRLHLLRIGRLDSCGHYSIGLSTFTVNTKITNFIVGHDLRMI